MKWLRSLQWRAVAAMAVAVLCGVFWPPVGAWAEESSPSPSGSVTAPSGSPSSQSSEASPSPALEVTPSESSSSSPEPTPSPTGEAVYVDIEPGGELESMLAVLGVLSVLTCAVVVFQTVVSLGR